MKKAHPSQVIDAASLIPISRKSGIVLQAIQKDIELLIAAFMSESQHTFADFVSCWQKIGFMHVHLACVEQDYRQGFMQAFYDSTLNALHSPLKTIRSAVLYALYMLYFSQPSTWERARIRITPELWKDLFDIYITCARHGPRDVALVFYQLKEDGAFMIVHGPLKTPNVFEQAELAESDEWLNAFCDIKRRRYAQDAAVAAESSTFNSLAQQYDQAKALVLTTPQATIGMQVWLRESMSVRETNPRLLRNVLLKSSLAIPETAFTEARQIAVQKLWQQRCTRLHTISS